MPINRIDKERLNKDKGLCSEAKVLCNVTRCNIFCVQYNLDDLCPTEHITRESDNIEKSLALLFR